MGYSCHIFGTDNRGQTPHWAIKISSVADRGFSCLVASVEVVMPVAHLRFV